MKTLSTIYVKPNMGVMALTHSSTFHSNSLKFTQKPLQNSNKFRINSNKLGKFGIKLKQAVSKVS